MKFSNWRIIGGLTALFLTGLSAPALAQEREQEQPQHQRGQVARAAVGKEGQRQTREHTQTNIEPMGRINNRIANRIQGRMRNRIDRYYDPQANVTSPFEVAAERVRKAGAPARR